MKDLEKIKNSKIVKKEVVFLKEFKKFISRGSVVDLAVGVVVGGAFSKIVTSLVNDIIMPLIGIIIGGIDFSNLTLTFKNATISYGLFIQNVIDFLIIAFCIFLFVRFFNRLTSLKKEEKPAVTKAKSDDVVLLEEIRDLLKDNKNVKSTKTKAKK